MTNMLTYIWNTEYEVFIASAESEWQAREKLKAKMGLNLISEILIDNPTEQQKEARSREGVNHMVEAMGFLNAKAAYIFKEGEVLIYNHANE